jgi:hypothetical protein
MIIAIFSLSIPVLFADQLPLDSGTNSISKYYLIGFSPYSVDGYASESSHIGTKEFSYLPMLSISSVWSSPRGNDLRGIGLSCGYTQLNNSTLLFDSQQHNYVIPWVSLYLWKGIHFFSETNNSGFYFSYDFGIEFLILYKDGFKHCDIPDNLALTLKWGGGYSFQTENSFLQLGIETTFPYIPIFMYEKNKKYQFFAACGFYPYVSMLL